MFRASMCPSSGEKLLYLCDSDICHSVWVASGLLVGLSMGGIWYAGWISIQYAHHREKIAISKRHWYLSLCVGGIWSDGWIEIQPADQTHPHRVTNTSVT